MSSMTYTFRLIIISTIIFMIFIRLLRFINIKNQVILNVSIKLKIGMLYKHIIKIKL